MNREEIIIRVAQSVLAGRGLQVRRKDKDLMDDTGGVSKGRNREPSQKPSRDDVKHRGRPKDKPAPDRDGDTDTDRDTTSDKDTRRTGFFLDIPEPSYADRVKTALVHVFADERGVSEKAFDTYDGLILEAKQTVEGHLDLVNECEREKARPQLCAEILYGTILASGSCKKNSIIHPICRTASNAGRATSILARFPQTFRTLVQREG
jgi:hypothetical protein